MAYSQNLVLVFNKNTGTEQIISKKSYELAQKKYKLLKENYTPKQGETGYQELTKSTSVNRFEGAQDIEYPKTIERVADEPVKRTRKTKAEVELNPAES